MLRKTRHYIPQPQTPRPPRPLGVWWLTIADGLTVGVFPIALLAVFLFYGRTGLSGAILTLGLGVAVLAAAFWTWKGNDRARMWLLILVALHYSLAIFNQLTLLVQEGVDANTQTEAYLSIGRSVLWIALNSWYFLRPATLAFYRFAVVDPDEAE